MEKYGQYRDKGSGIAPFFTIAPPPSSPLLVPYHIFLFFFRLPFLIFAWTVWIVLVQWTPAGGALRKANLWCILGLPGVWWIDIRVDGVQRGSLGKSGRLPGPSTIIASSYTSPLDVLYLAAIFDPIFTQSYPTSRRVTTLSLLGALASCLSLPPPRPATSETQELSELVAANPTRVIVVFPEGTTSNGRGVLRLSPSLLSAAPGTPIFPVSLRYTPADVVTPIPGLREAIKFIWILCSRQTHAIRVRIGFPVKIAQLKANAAAEDRSSSNGNGPAANNSNTNSIPPILPAPKVGESGLDYYDRTSDTSGDDHLDRDPAAAAALTLSASERRSLDAVAESLSRLGRAKTLGLGVEEKVRFVEAWLGGGSGGSGGKGSSRKRR